MAVALVGAIGTALSWSAATVAWVQIGVGLTLAAITRRNLRSSTANVGIQTSTPSQGGVTPQRFILGEYATAGHAHAAYSAGGEGNDDCRYRVFELSDVPVNDLLGLYINDKYFEWTTDFEFTAGQDFRSADDTVHDGAYHEKVYVKFYDGRQTTADAQMVSRFGAHTERPYLSTHVGEGVAYGVIAFRGDRELFPNGEPNVLWVVRGVQAYDDRIPGHDYADPLTWGFSKNPVTQISTIMRGLPLPDGAVWGVGVESDQLPSVWWDAAANECDSAANSGIMEANFEVSLDQEPWDVIDELARACDAELCDMGGEWIIRVGPPGVAAVSITDGDILGSKPQRLDPVRALSERLNTVQAKFIDPSARYEPVALPLAQDATALTDHGERISTDINLRAVTDSTQAQKLADAWVKDAQRNRVHQIVLPPQYSDLSCLDSISWTSDRNGYTAKVFEIVQMDIDEGTLCATLTIRERDPADYTPGALPPYTPPSASKITRPGVALSNVSGAPVEKLDTRGDKKLAGIRISWDTDGLTNVRAVRYQVRFSGDSGTEVEYETTNVQAGYIDIYEGILARETYEVRAEPVRYDRQTIYSAWVEVITGEAFVTTVDFGDSVVPASALLTSNYENVYPDANFEDSRFYSSSLAGHTLATTAIDGTELGVLNIPVGGADHDVVSKWYPLTPNTQYRAGVSAWLFSAAAGAGDVAVYLQFSAADANGDATGAARTATVVTRTDSANTDLANINFTTQASERLYRFVFRRFGGGTAAARFARPSIFLRSTPELITDDAKNEVVRLVGTAVGAAYVVPAAWTTILSGSVDKLTDTSVDVAIQLPHENDFPHYLRIMRGATQIGDTFQMAVSVTGQTIFRGVWTDDTTASGSQTYSLQIQRHSADTTNIGKPEMRLTRFARP